MGHEAPTMSPTMRCVIILSGLYFAVDMGLFLSQTLATYYRLVGSATGRDRTGKDRQGRA